LPSSQSEDSDKDRRGSSDLEMESATGEDGLFGVRKGISNNSELAQILLRESKNPWRVMMAQLGVLVMLLVFAIARGSSSASTKSVFGVQGCSAGYVQMS
jgi:hypothetical protein